MRHYTISLCALIFAMSLIAAPAVVRPADDVVSIPVILSLTGPAAFLGKEERIGFELGEKMINASGGIRKRPVRFDVRDDTSVPQVAVQLLNEFSSNGKQVVIGSTLAASCGALLPLVANGPVNYCLSPAIHPEAGTNVFTAGVGSGDSFVAMIRFLRIKGITKLAIISSTDASGQDSEKGALDAAKLPENSTIQIPVVTHFAASDLTIAAQVSQIEAAQPQAIFAASSGAGLGTILRGLAQAGINLPVITPYSNMTYNAMTAYAAFLPKQLYFPSSMWVKGSAGDSLTPAVVEAQKNFYDAYKGVDSPDSGSMLAWDAMMIVVSAMQKLGPDAKSTQIRDYLAHLKGYAGINGVYNFDESPQRGLTEKNVIMALWNPQDKVWNVVSKPGGIPIK